MVTWLTSSNKCAAVYQISSKSDDFLWIYGDLTIFKMAAIRYLEFSKFRIYVTWPLSPYHCVIRVKLHWNWKTDCWVMAKKRFLKWRSSAILNFKNVHKWSHDSPSYKPGHMTHRVTNLLLCTKFHWNVTIFVEIWHMAISRFQDGRFLMRKGASERQLKNALALPDIRLEHHQSPSQHNQLEVWMAEPMSPKTCQSADMTELSLVSIRSDCPVRLLSDLMYSSDRLLQ